MLKYQTMYSMKIKKGEIMKCDGRQFHEDCKRRVKGESTMFILLPHARSDFCIARILCKKCAALENPKFVKAALVDQP